MKRTQITVTLAHPPGAQPTVGDAQDLFDALDEVASRMGVDVRVEAAGFEVTICDACGAESEKESSGTMSASDDPDLCPECAGRPLPRPAGRPACATRPDGLVEYGEPLYIIPAPEKRNG